MNGDEQKIVFENAKWFAKELGNFSALDQIKLVHAKDFREFQDIVWGNRRFDSPRLWQGKIDRETLESQGIMIPIASPKAPEAPKEHKEKHTHEDHVPHQEEEEEKKEAEAEKEKNQDENVKKEKPASKRLRAKIALAALTGKLIAGKKTAPASTHNTPPSNALQGKGQSNAISTSSLPVIPAERWELPAQQSQLEETVTVTRTSDSPPPINQSPKSYPQQDRGRLTPSLPRGAGRNPGQGMIRRGAGSLGKKVAKKTAKKMVVSVATNPITYYVIGAILIVIFILWMYFMIMSRLCELTNGAPLREIWAPALHERCRPTDYEVVPLPPPGITIVKSGPTEIENATPIDYEIRVTYTPADADPNIPLSTMTLVDSPNFDFTDASSIEDETLTGTEPNQNIEWKLSDLLSETNLTHTYHLTVLPSVQNQSVTNTVWVDTPGSRRTSPECVDDPVQCLNNEFKFIVQGNPPKNKVLDVYTLLSEIAASNKYRALLRNAGDTKYLVFENGTAGGCPGGVETRISGGVTTITFTLLNYDTDRCPRRERKSRLAHESGHVLKSNPASKYEYFIDNIYRMDRNCYYYDNFRTFRDSYYFINTYNTQYGKDNLKPLQGYNESFAELIALHVIPIGNYPRVCPIAAEWIKENIFGGHTY